MYKMSFPVIHNTKLHNFIKIKMYHIKNHVELLYNNLEFNIEDNTVHDNSAIIEILNSYNSSLLLYKNIIPRYNKVIDNLFEKIVRLKSEY